VCACVVYPQDDASLDLNAFRDRFGDVPQKGELTLLCPLKEDPTEKVCRPFCMHTPAGSVEAVLICAEFGGCIICAA
jgi:hypothetical protein